MRPIHLAALDRTRPVLILTREQVRPLLSSITVVPRADAHREGGIACRAPSAA